MCISTLSCARLVFLYFIVVMLSGEQYVAVNTGTEMVFSVPPKRQPCYKTVDLLRGVFYAVRAEKL
jgi:hypothetical protein